MKKFWESFKEMKFSHKVAHVIGLTSAIAVIVLVILQFTNVWPNAINVYVPLLALMNYTNVFLLWNTSRSSAIFNLVCAIFITICSICVWVLP